MAKSKKQAALAVQAGYQTVRCQHLRSAASTPVASSPIRMPSTARWRYLMDKAHHLTQMLSEEMAAYSQTRQAAWYETLGAEIFLDCMEELTEVQGLLDDLRSNF